MEKLKTLYAGLVRLYREGEEIPICRYEGCTITLKDAWTGAYRVYDETGNKTATVNWWWDACCEVVRVIHNLDEFPYESRFDVPTNPYYDEAVHLQLTLAGDDLAEIIRNMAKEDN